MNEVLRAERHPDELSNDELVAVRALVQDLDVLLARWRTPEPVRVYRGLRSRVGFDVDESPAVSRSFLSTTVFRDVAIREFTVPPGPGGPALLEIDVPVGTPGVWVPQLGDRALAYQGELLLSREVRLALRGLRAPLGAGPAPVGPRAGDASLVQLTDWLEDLTSTPSGDRATTRMTPACPANPTARR